MYAEKLLALYMSKRRKDKVYLTLYSFCFEIHSCENNVLKNKNFAYFVTELNFRCAKQNKIQCD